MSGMIRWPKLALMYDLEGRASVKFIRAIKFPTRKIPLSPACVRILAEKLGTGCGEGYLFASARPASYIPQAASLKTMPWYAMSVLICAFERGIL